MAKGKPHSLAAERASGGLALLIIDMISCWDFPDADKLQREALAIAPAIARFKARCQRAGVPTIYANDNMGRWRSDFRAMVLMTLQGGSTAAAITTALLPQPEDYFVLKPKHSAFHATPLALLLAHLQVKTLIVAGVSSDQCVMTSVAEARMREMAVIVPRDLVASQNKARNEAALLQFSQVHGLPTPMAARVRLPEQRTSSGR